MTDRPTVLDRPPFDVLLARRRAEYQAAFPAGDALRAQGVLPAFAHLDAMSQHELHAHLDAVAAAQHPMFARGPWLLAWAQAFRVEPKPATRAAGVVAFSGVAGAMVPAGAMARRSDGVEYRLTADAGVVEGVAAASVEAVGLGPVGNALPGLPLTLISPVAGLDPRGVVQAPGLTGGAAAEDDESLRTRVMEALRRPAHGGNADDWRNWALAVPGVTRAWVTENAMGLGTVTVRFVMDDTYPDGVPVGTGAPDYSGDLLAVWQALDAERPAGMRGFFVVAPQAVGLDIEVSGLTPDTPAIRDAVIAELTDLLRRVSKPGATVWRSWVVEALSAATGESYHGRVRLGRGGEPVADVESVACGVNDLPVLGEVTYV